MSSETIAGPKAADGAEERRRRLAGIGLMCLALVCFTGIDTSAKWLGRGLPPLEISFFRYLIAFVLAALVFSPRRVPDAWRTRRPGLQILRGLCLLGSTVFNFVALRHLQLAETMTIAFSAPLLIALLSGPVLGERVDRLRWVLIGLGFVGIVVIARPTVDAFRPTVLWAFAGISCYAIYAVVTRRLAGVDSSASMLIFSTGLPILLLGPALPMVWVSPPSLHTWVVLTIMGTCGALGHLLLTLAFARAPASVVAPFGYTQILWMTLSGWIFFGDLPDLVTIVGGAVVIAGGLPLLWLEHRPARASAR